VQERLFVRKRRLCKPPLDAGTEGGQIGEDGLGVRLFLLQPLLRRLLVEQGLAALGQLLPARLELRQ
jgi:hypothetical protein